MSGNLDVVDIEGAFDKIVIMNRGFELIRRYGKISVLHLTGEHVGAQAFGAGRHQILAERVSSSPTINDNKCSTRRAAPRCTMCFLRNEPCSVPVWRSNRA